MEVPNGAKSQQQGTMDKFNFDWLNTEYDLGFELPRSQSESPRASLRASLAAERTDPPSGEHAFPLLRLGVWNKDKHYNKDHPDCIHYDLR